MTKKRAMTKKKVPKQPVPGALARDERSLVALGATAAQALFGKAFRVTRDRGWLITSHWAPHALATVHPSSLLRALDEETRHRETVRFIEDLAEVLRSP